MCNCTRGCAIGWRFLRYLKKLKKLQALAGQTGPCALLTKLLLREHAAPGPCVPRCPWTMLARHYAAIKGNLKKLKKLQAQITESFLSFLRFPHVICVVVAEDAVPEDAAP